MKQYVIFLYDKNRKLIDNPIIEGICAGDALSRFTKTKEGKNSNIKSYEVREWKGCKIDEGSN